ncbi:hypothetical protein PR048_004862 [Dryococelus australis]|uniref:Uncharacterized protein n=1 Tax=Dryococelus australis TaxID=614101 RepID=A0ABQ9I719_9NEOP|nr:hypothetical protein PR048_004862 [Dryococelus australis]
MKGRSRGLKLSRLFLSRGRSPSPNPLKGTSPPVSPTGYPLANIPSSPPSHANSWNKLQLHANHDEEELIPKRNILRTNTISTTFTYKPVITKRTEQ